MTIQEGAVSLAKQVMHNLGSGMPDQTAEAAIAAAELLRNRPDRLKDVLDEMLTPARVQLHGHMGPKATLRDLASARPPDTYNRELKPSAWGDYAEQHPIAATADRQLQVGKVLQESGDRSASHHAGDSYARSTITTSGHQVEVRQSGRGNGKTSSVRADVLDPDFESHALTGMVANELSDGTVVLSSHRQRYPGLAERFETHVVISGPEVQPPVTTVTKIRSDIGPNGERTEKFIDSSQKVGDEPIQKVIIPRNQADF